MIKSERYDELLNEIIYLDTSSFNGTIEQEKIFYVDLNTRKISIPPEFQTLAIQGDHCAETVWFVINRHFDGKDLFDYTWGVQVQMPDKAKTRKLLLIERKKFEEIENTFVNQEDFDKDAVYLGWPITYDVTELAGDLSFALCGFKKSEDQATDENGDPLYTENGQKIFKLDYRIGTLTSKVKIQESLVINEEEDVMSPPITRVETLIDMLSDQIGETGGISVSWENVTDKPQIDGQDLTKTTSSEFFKNVDFNKLQNVPTINGHEIQKIDNLQINYEDLENKPVFKLLNKKQEYILINGEAFDTSQLRFNYDQIDGTPTLSYDNLSEKPKIKVDGVEYEINNESIIEVSKIAVDDILSEGSTNPVQNKVLYAKFKAIEDELGNMSFIPIEIKTFEADNYLFEKGSKATPTLSWSLSKEPVSLSLKANDIEVSTTNENYTSAEIQEDTTFKLSVSDGKTSAEDSLDIKFVNRVYWGVAAEPESYDSTFVQTLDSELLETKEKTFTVNALDNEYIYFAIPVSYGDAVISVGGFTNGFESPQQITVTNEYNSTDYYLYRSTNPRLGNTTVVVS